MKNKSVPTVHKPCVCTPYVQESKKLRDLIFNKDKRKFLAHKNGNENPIWSWNESVETSETFEIINLTRLYILQTLELYHSSGMIQNLTEGTLP